MVKPSKLNRISVGVSDREYAELQALSEKHRVSMAWLGRHAIVEFLDRYGDEEQRLPLNLPSEPRRARG